MCSNPTCQSSPSIIEEWGETGCWSVMSHPDPEPGVRMTISLLLCFMRASTSSRWSVCGVRTKAYKCTFQRGSPCGIFTFTNFYTSVVCWSPVNQHNLNTKKRREEEGCDSEEDNGMQTLQWRYSYAVIMQMWTLRKKKENEIKQNSNKALMSDLLRVSRPSRGWTVDIHTSPRGQRAGGLRWTDRVSPRWLCPCSAFDRPRKHRTSPHLENTRKCVWLNDVYKPNDGRSNRILYSKIPSTHVVNHQQQSGFDSCSLSLLMFVHVFSMWVCPWGWSIALIALADCSFVSIMFFLWGYHDQTWRKLVTTPCLLRSMYENCMTHEPNHNVQKIYHGKTQQCLWWKCSVLKG